MNEPHRWRKAASSGNEGACVELAHTDDGGLVRDSKNPAGGALALTVEAFESVLSAARAGGLDLH